MTVAKIVIATIAFLFVTLSSLNACQQNTENIAAASFQRSQLKQEIERLKKKLDPSPFDSQDKFSPPQLLLQCLKFDETASEAIQLIIKHSQTNKQVAVGFKKHLQAIIKRGIAESEEEDEGDIPHYTYLLRETLPEFSELSPLLKPLLAHPETFEFAAQLFLESFENSEEGELQKSARELLIIGKHEKYKKGCFSAG